MGRKKKRKFNILYIPLLLVIGLLCFSIIKGVNIYKEENKTEEKKEEKSTTSNDNKKDSKTEKKEDDKISKYKKTSNFKLENLDRYIIYHEKNPNYDDEKVVTYVNIGLDKEFYSYIKDADMKKGILLLCNKYLKLPDGYEPDDLETINSEYFINGNTLVRKLRKEAKEAFENLSKASIEEGYPVYGQSAFREYDMQVSLYNNAVNSLGKAKADIDTARPGHSEHQTGLTIDVSSTKGGNMMSFENTKSFDWMQNNAHKYGFILRYRKDKVDITGFMYESWHYRYVGVKVATDMHDNYPDLSYEEYYYKFIDNK